VALCRALPDRERGDSHLAEVPSGRLNVARTGRLTVQLPGKCHTILSKPQASPANCRVPQAPHCRLVQSCLVQKSNPSPPAPLLLCWPGCPSQALPRLLAQADSHWGPSGLRYRSHRTPVEQICWFVDLEEYCLTPQVVMTGSLNTLQHSWQHSFTDGCSANTSGSLRGGEKGAERAQGLV